MKGGKDEEKVMGPLFPRLHVNDTERGGPRAPPRNKMALYEQLSIPSQRLNSAGASGLPDKRHITRTVVPSASLGQDGGQERRVFSPFYIPSLALDYSTQKVLPRSSDGTDLDATRMELERKSTKNVSSRALNITGHFLSSVEGSSTHPNSSSNSKNSCGKKVGDEDEFKVPTYSHLGLTPYSSKDQQSGGRESPTPFPLFQGCSMVIATNSPQKSVPTTCTSSSQLEKNLDMPLKGVDTTNQKLRQHGRNPVGEQPVETVAAKDHMENSASHPSTAEKNEEPSKYARISLNEEQEARARFLANNDSVGGVSIEPRCYTSNAASERGNVSRVWKEPDSGASLRTSHVSPTEARNCNEKTKEVEHQSLQVGKVDRNDDVSDTSMVDSISGSDISPDDVVGVIGQKHFWKARRAIVNQQRVFAVQVFELHRLIKVQKFIASSPHLLLEGYPYLGRPSLKVLAKQLPSDIVKSQQQIRKPKDDSQKPSQSTDCPTETVVGKTLLPPVNDGIRKGQSQISNNGPCPGNLPPPAPVAAENKPDAWRFHPPGNQWLVPVMSPSEGLVYKPYTGSCSLPAGFMAPVYGSSGPVGLSPFPAYGVSAARPQPGVGVISCAPAVVPNYFPPYSMLVMNPIAPSQAVEQVNTSGGARPYEPAEQISVREVDLNMHSGISCNMSNQKSEAFSCPVLKIPTSEGSEVQGSTGSSPIDREQRAGHDLEGRNAIPLFPLAPSVECSDQNHHADISDQQIHAIKVVPYNPRSATESAARIFQSIQEERQQFHST